MATHSTTGTPEAVPPEALQQRLDLMRYDEADCLAAIKGERIPVNLGLKITRLCLIRGLRYHTNFGQCLYSLQDPVFTRALNARRIMSNDIPEMNAPEEFPYCIWYPDVAREETYMKLALKYPQMRYNVGRACAVAGYSNLFRQLDLLPEISIAEEARENQESGQDIFEDIVKQAVRYAIMDDYTCSVDLDNPRGGAYLNGDTAVRCLLDIKQQFGEPYYPMDDADAFPVDSHSEENHFNITEDWNVDVFDAEPLDYTSVVTFLSLPLPLDLPTVHKDLLIIMAAYYGNIDRFDRLRRPIAESTELSAAITHGTYHNTMFAKWLSSQPIRSPDMNHYGGHARAINARWIMNNDLSRITEETPENELPTQIWYPDLAHFATYEELARRKPSMKATAARACIVADYQESYERIEPIPDFQLLKQAEVSKNPFYLEDLERRAKDMNIDLNVSMNYEHDQSRYIPAKIQPANPETTLSTRLPMDDISWSFHSPYDGLGLDVTAVELLACLPDELKPTEDFPILSLESMYLQACRPGENHAKERFPGGRQSRNFTRGRVSKRGRGRI